MVLLCRSCLSFLFIVRTRPPLRSATTTATLTLVRNMSHKMWDERYGASGEFVYGTEPNDFLKDTWPTLGLAAGSKCLLLADGEGRNGVYLAQLGMSVTGVDISKVGLDKAQQLASERNVSIETQVADLATYDLGMEQWDAIVSISNHLPPPIRERVLGAIPSALKPGGYFVLEGYTPEQLEYKTGGPPDAAMMYSREMLDEAFGSKNDDSTKRLEIIRNEELVRTVVEGQYHTGKGAVVQFIGKKTMQS